jgi:hypothetical protein
MKYIYHHLGLGDHIINNGMVRHFYNEYGALTLFAYKHNVKNVQYMYRDLEKFQVIGVESDPQVDQYISNNNLDCIKIGFGDLSDVMPELPFDKAFYKLAGLDFSVRFDEFYFERDLEKEKEVLNILNPTGEKYIFIHDDSSRGFSIDMSRIKIEYKVIMNYKRFNVFDYITLIENAEEIHFMQSSFKELMCSYELKKPTLYQHNYVRQYDESMNSSGLNPFIEIN